MIELNIKNNPVFCPNENFRKDIINILCASLFVPNSKDLIDGVYQTMDSFINKDDANLLYPMDARLLDSGIDKQNINQNGNIYAGHDLPVWLGNPKEPGIRIMVVSQDPRRSEREMRQIGLSGDIGGIALSSPFGLHSYKWRSSKKTGLIHYLFTEMIQDYAESGKSLSVYYTDVYKLRGVDAISAGKIIKTSVTDINNTEYYFKILQEEFNLFNPTIVLLLGTEAQKAFDQAKNNINISSCTPVEVPHPSAQWSTWKEYTSSYKTNERIQFYKDSIKEKLSSC